MELLFSTGKVYPINTIYASMCMNLESDYVKATAEKVEEIILSDKPDERGGILAFFAEAGQAERAAKILEAKGSPALKRATLYQLHGRLQLEDQRKVFNHDSSEICTNELIAL